MYSQFGEDEVIVKHVGDTGRFLDIGAFHPECFSNTRVLYLGGWSGVMFEPSPKPFANLQAAYEGDPRIVLVNKAVGFDVHPVKMYVTEDAVSTTDPATYEKWKNHAKYDGEITVESITLEQINNQYGGFDFVNFDAEGISVDLCIHYLALGCRPKCFCVEHDDRIVEVSQPAIAAGYKVVLLNGTNAVFAR